MTEKLIYVKPLNLQSSVVEAIPKPAEVLKVEVKAEPPEVRDYVSPDFGAFFKDRYSLFYAGDRTTCPVCLTKTKLDKYMTRGRVRKVDHLCPECGSAYPLIRPSIIPKLRFPLR